MKVQAIGFSRNGKQDLVGILKVTDDEGEPFGLQHKGNYSDLKVKNFFIKAIVGELGVDEDRARATVTRALRDVDIELTGQEALPDEDVGRKSQSTQLVDLALSGNCELWHSSDGTPFATMEVNGHLETWWTHSKSFRNWLSHQFFLVQGKSPGSQAVYDALSVLDGKAAFEGAEYPVYVRIAEVDGAIYLDLANDNWEAVKVTASGWEVVADPPVKFKRSRGMLSLPHPVPGGDLGKLRRMLNISGGDAEWSLFLGCLVQTMRGRGPYPVLVIYGEHGSAKSTVSRVFRRLVDPNKADLRSPPRDERDMMIQACNSWVVAYDNLSRLPEWFSNALCRLSTGGGMGTRELWTNDEESIFEGQRPIVLNGIEEITSRPDLVDRAVVLMLQAIPDTHRKSESEFWDEFDRAHAEILGGLLDGVSVGLRNLKIVCLPKLPRMADFAIWATAAEPGLGLRSGTFLAAYESNRAEANEATLDASPLATYVRQFAELEGDWTGTCTDLLSKLENLAEEKELRHKNWPTQASVLSGKIRALAPNLRAAGVEVNQSDPNSPRRNGLKRWVRVRIAEIEGASENNLEKERPERPQRPTECENTEIRGRDADAEDDKIASAASLLSPQSDHENDQIRAHNDAGDGEDAESATHSNGSPQTFENVCQSCRRSVPTEEVGMYLEAPGEVICVNCDPQ